MVALLRRTCILYYLKNTQAFTVRTTALSGAVKQKPLLQKYNLPVNEEYCIGGF